MSTLNEDIDNLAKTALRIAEERNVLLRLVKRGADATNYVGWRLWIDEAEVVLKSMGAA